MNINNSVLDYIRYVSLNRDSQLRRMNDEWLPRKFWNGVCLEEKEREDFEMRG